MTDAADLLKTPLHALHIELGGKMVPFAGYDMPVQYPAGVLKEHLHTRTKAGLFDVSHMGQVRLDGANAAAAMETLVPVDIIDLPAFTQRYALFTSDDGGILDDLMITNAGDHLFVVVNAACKEQDIAHMRANLGDDVKLTELNDRALLALQGPSAMDIMQGFSPEAAKMIFMQAMTTTIDGIEVFISRSGYTGEDGFEISVKADQAEQLARTLLAHDDVMPIGLGARDSLRLEVGLCLYGHDINTDTSPIEGGLIWAISKNRRADGARAGGFKGADKVLADIANGVKRKRVGIKPLGRAPVREGAELQDKDGNHVGEITSGSFGPSAGHPVAMGYVTKPNIKAGTELVAIVRGKPFPVEVFKLPFVKQTYYRG